MRKQTFRGTMESSRAITEVGLERTINQMENSLVTNGTEHERLELQQVAGERIVAKYGLEASLCGEGTCLPPLDLKVNKNEPSLAEHCT